MNRCPDNTGDVYDAEVDEAFEELQHRGNFASSSIPTHFNLSAGLSLKLKNIFQASRS